MGLSRILSTLLRPPVRGAALAGLAVGIAVPLSFWGLDLGARRLYGQIRPELETLLGRSLGHPVILGPYAGLRPWGVALGTTAVLEGPADASTASIDGVRAILGPLASLRRRRPVVGVSLGSARIDLRRNAEGVYWVIPPQTRGEPPALDLRVRTTRPIRVRVEPASLPGALALEAEAQLQERRLQGRARLTLPEDGRIDLRGTGSWADASARAQIHLDRLSLASLEGLAPESSPLQLKGALAGRLDLGWENGSGRCQGRLGVRGLRIDSDRLPAPLASSPWALRCQDQLVTLEPALWRMGDWRASLAGEVALLESFDLALSLTHTSQNQSFDSRLSGPWHQPILTTSGQWQPPQTSPLQGPVQLRATLLADLRNGLKATMSEANVRAPGLRLDASGRVLPRLELSTSRLDLSPGIWAKVPLAEQLLGSSTPIDGRLLLTGKPGAAKLQLNLAQSANPILERWSLAADWDQSLLRLRELRSPDLRISGSMPLSTGGSGIEAGELDGALSLEAFPLERIGRLLGTRLDGQLSASGSLHGAWTAVEPELEIRIEDPLAGPVRLLEFWEGTLMGREGGGGRLSLSPSTASLPGSLTAELNRSWLPTVISLQRRSGRLSLEGDPSRYLWQATGIPLQGLQVAPSSDAAFLGLQGLLSGSGSLGLQPLAIEGEATLTRPGVAGLQVSEIALNASLADRLLNLEGTIAPPTVGTIDLAAVARFGGSINLEVSARGLSIRWLGRLITDLPGLRHGQVPGTGAAADLTGLMLGAADRSIDEQLRLLDDAHEQWAAWREAHQDPRPFSPDALRGVVDADVQLSGPRGDDLQLDVTATGHLWAEGQNVDQALAFKPFEGRWSGPLQSGEGEFGLSNLPFSLLALFAPVPPALTGGAGLTGRYRLGGPRPQLSTEISLDGARLGDWELTLEKGSITLAGSALDLDLALRAAGASEAVTLAGSIPLLPQDDGLEVRLVGHGDALSFLTALAGDQVVWKQGSADVRLIVQGQLLRPQANGFLRIRGGEVDLAGQTVEGIESTMLFDFDTLDVQSFSARMGPEGTIEARGAIGLFAPINLNRDDPLEVTSERARLVFPIADVEADARLVVGGALPAMRLSGELDLARGSITPRRATLLSAYPALGSDGMNDPQTPPMGRGEPINTNVFREEQWDFQSPLVLLGPEVESSQGMRIRERVPRLSFIGFDDLRVRIGAELTVAVAPVAEFSTSGLLILNGRLDETLVTQGVIRLTRGRISLFTTTFNLDAIAPNVAVFTPGLGLMPYVDVVLTTRVSESLNVGNGLSSDIFERNGTGGLGFGGQLRLIKVVLEGHGPADRLAGSIQLRSTPSLPQTQLLALIGGNSLAGLSGGNAGAALAAALGQSLLSPVLGTLSEAFNERLRFALYPTYVTPFVPDQEEINSRRVPPQLVLGTEVGLDVTDRFNFSVLVAPNRNDIPPQGTVSYQVIPSLAVEGSLDAQGSWQSQLQLFLRF